MENEQDIPQANPADPAQPAQNPAAGAPPAPKSPGRKPKTKKAKADKNDALEVDFSYEDREFACIASIIHVPGIGRLRASEIDANAPAKKLLVSRLDERGSGVIREVFS